MLGAAQTFGFRRRIEERLRPVGPGQPPQRRFEQRADAGWAAGEQPAFPFDHHRARFGQRGGDQSNAGIGLVPRDAADPFGPGAGLAEAAPGTDQPYPPVARRGKLLRPGPLFPMPAQPVAFAAVERLAKAGS